MSIAVDRKPSIHRLLCLLLAPAAASMCGCPTSHCVTPSPSAPSASTLIQCALGTDARGDAPTTADAYLLLVEDKQSPESGTRLTPACAKISSIMPDPRQDAAMLLVIDGALHILRPSESTPVPLALALPPPVRLGNDRSLRLTRLLGARIQSKPLQILAAVIAEGSSEIQIWALTLSDTAVVGAELLPNERIGPIQQEFFETYSSPRCQPDGTRCLLLTYDGTQYHIDFESRRGVRPETLTSLDAMSPRDVAWKAGGESLYLVMPCSS